MKYVSTVLVCLMTFGPVPSAFAEAPAGVYPAEEGDLTALGQADLRVRLAWARYYLSTLEANDRHVANWKYPRVTSNDRTSYAISKTAVETGGLVAATYAAGRAIKSYAKAFVAMREAPVPALKERIAQLKWGIRKAARIEKAGKFPASLPTAAENVPLFKTELKNVRGQLDTIKGNRNFTTLKNVGRVTVATFGIGVAAALITDMGITWFQVKREAGDIEERKADLRQFIAYAEQKLAGDDDADLAAE